jgi:hypothetical protein
MSFDIARTPTLHAVATGDEQRLVEDLQERVESAIRHAAETTAVVEAVSAQRRAEQRFLSLQKAERALNQFVKSAGEKLSVMREAVLDSVIESAAGGDKLDFKGLSELAALETRSRQTTRAIERLVERLLPMALWTRLQEESHAAITLSRTLEGIAQERAERAGSTAGSRRRRDDPAGGSFARCCGGASGAGRRSQAAWRTAFEQRGFHRKVVGEIRHEFKI